MKRHIYFILITISLNSFGQTFGLNKETNLLTYEEIINIDSMKAEDIYKKVKEWAILSFRNSEKVIVGENKPTLLKATFIQKYFNGMGVYADYYNTITIKIKDGAVKIIIDDMRMTSGYKVEGTVYKKDGTLRTGNTYQKIYEDIEFKCKGLIKDLTNFLSKEDVW
ncbi:MAG: DUF4468 domain-containing protein [Bacteroidetes bacterium]|nr:DUF4468 domain-containing protein [Bacteroidota bacterium]MBL7103858.1 DUF4468 domain-containing protein [Bacteroidales bacterium]